MIGFDRLPTRHPNGRRRGSGGLARELRLVAERVQARGGAHRRRQSILPAGPATGAAKAVTLGLGLAVLVALVRRLRGRASMGPGSRGASDWPRGLSATATGFRGGLVEDAALEERVRSALDRVRGHTGAIDVQARDGVIVLSGPVLADEVARIRAATRGTRGVRDLVEMLDVRDEPGVERALQGPEGQPWATRESGWPPGARLAAVAGGWALAGASIAVASRLRRPLLAAPGVAAGAALALRGVTNRPLGRILGVGRDRRGIDVEQSIELDAPVEAAFALWDREPEFPRFMQHVRDVRMNRDGTSDWTIAGPAGIPIGFRAETTERVPNERIAWRSLDGEPIRHAGSVQFDRRPGDRCRVTVRMTYEPPAGILGHALAHALGADPKRALDDDLRRFESLLVHGRTRAEGARVPGAMAPSAPAWSPMAAGAAMSPAAAAMSPAGAGMSPTVGMSPAAGLPGEGQGMTPGAEGMTPGAEASGSGLDVGESDEEGASR